MAETDRVNYLNIGLMGLSAALAFKIPFELFLFSYTVMGPLHYLTEISWLHDRNYYTKGKYDYLFLVGLGVAVTLLFIGVISGAPKGLTPALTCLAFLSALVFATLSGTWTRIAGLVGAGAASYLFASSFAYREFFGIFLPTLIHVFILTGLFILAGALKGRSRSGFLSLMVFVGLGSLFFFLHPAEGHPVGDYVRNNYGYLKEDGTLAGSFAALNISFIRDLDLYDFGAVGTSSVLFVAGANDFLYHHPTALSLMAFIAFAYTYHYFNWFSKTSVIRWHLIPRKRLIGILLLWGVSLGLYAYDYLLGLKWLFFLSFVHVLLEFPLNHLTVVQIGKELKRRVTGGTQA